MPAQRSVVFAVPARTAIGAFGGAFKDIPAPDRDRCKFGGQTAIACGCECVSLAGWNLCP
jgi:hypothetical protein